MDPAIGAALISSAATLGSSALGLASRQQPTGTTHQAKLGLKYGKLYDEWSAKNMPTYNREGMEKAGFNPIMAYSSGQSAHGMPSISGAGAYDSFNVPDLSSAVSAYYNARSAANSLDMQRQQIDNAKAQGTNIAALTALYGAQRAKAIRDTLFPPNATMWYDLKHLVKYGVKNGAFKAIGEGMSGYPNNIVNVYNQNNNGSSASGNYHGTFYDAMKNSKPSDFKISLPLNPSFPQQ